MIRNPLWADTNLVVLLSQLCKPVSYQKSWAEQKKAGFEELTSDTKIMMTGMCGWIPRRVLILLASGLSLHYRTWVRSVLTSVLSSFVYSRDEHISVIYRDRCCAAMDHGSLRKVLEFHVKYQLPAPQPALPARVGEGLTFCFGMPFWIPEQNTWALWSSTASSEMENNLISFCPSVNKAKGQTFWLLSPEILGRLP